MFTCYILVIYVPQNVLDNKPNSDPCVKICQSDLARYFHSITLNLSMNVQMNNHISYLIY